MTDLEIAKSNLNGHTLSLCREGECRISDLKGISPMMNLIADGTDLTGYSVADLVVGKAAALLFVKCGIKEVYAKTLSQGGKDVLAQHHIPYEYGTLTEKVINRTGTDVCPMEKAVADTEDADEAYYLLKARLEIRDFML